MLAQTIYLRKIYDFIQRSYIFDLRRVGDECIGGTDAGVFN